jgi:cysteine desulfurase
MTYFDHNASTPVRPEVVGAMREALETLHGNPSSAHRDGQRARAAIERAREQVAALVSAEPRAVVFTSGGTEGDLLAIVGGARALVSRGRRIAISAVEHRAVPGAAEMLVREGFTIERLAVDSDGRVDPASVDGLPADTTMVSVMLANNETGVIEPVDRIAARARARGMRTHCDAVQAAGKIPIDVAALGADYLVVSAHKLGGPKGVGAVVVAADAPLEALQKGSGHERGRRSGTENVPGIVGFGVAAACAARELANERQRLEAMRARLEAGLLEALPDAVIHARSAPRLPNTVNVSIPGARSDIMLMALDARGFEISAGAACSSGAVEPSAVFRAMGVPREIAICALRLSMGRTTSPEDVERLLSAVVECAGHARAGSAV